MLRCTRSTMSMRAAVNTFVSSIFFEHVTPLISPKLFEMSTSNMALVCELMATDSATAWEDDHRWCDTVTAIVSAASNPSCAAAYVSSACDPPVAAVFTTMYTLFCNASNT